MPRFRGRKRRYRSITRSKRRQGLGSYISAKSLDNYLNHPVTNTVELDHFKLRNGVGSIHKAIQAQFRVLKLSQLGSGSEIADLTASGLTGVLPLKLNSLNDPLNGVNHIGNATYVPHYTPGFKLLGHMYQKCVVSSCIVEWRIVRSASAVSQLVDADQTDYKCYFIVDSSVGEVTTPNYNELNEAKYPYSLYNNERGDVGTKQKVYIPVSKYLVSSNLSGHIGERNATDITISSDVPAVGDPADIAFGHFLCFDTSGRVIKFDSHINIEIKFTQYVTYWGQRNDTLVV